MHTFLLCLTILACLVLATSWHEDMSGSPVIQSSEELESGATKSKIEKVSLSPSQIAIATLKNHFQVDNGLAQNQTNLEDFVNQFTVPDNFKSSTGLFVTFSKEGKTRACWGSLNPKYHNLPEATVYTTLDALKKEYRHTPIQKDEIKDLKAQVTVVKSVVPVQSTSSVNPLRDGLMVRANGKGAVILPGETCDNHMQLVMAKLKANINSNQSCQLYRIETDVYK